MSKIKLIGIWQINCSLLIIYRLFLNTKTKLNEADHLFFIFIRT